MYSPLVTHQTLNQVSSRIPNGPTSIPLELDNLISTINNNPMNSLRVVLLKRDLLLIQKPKHQYPSNTNGRCNATELSPCSPTMYASTSHTFMSRCSTIMKQNREESRLVPVPITLFEGNPESFQAT
ncbi:hypothetical protein SUGI_0962900 [Cryptomeria japonica]|nr:hypothetical protein SUGI_0962900 [Cryptomeria japonica]